MNKNVIEIKNLTKSFKKIKAVSNIEIIVKKGELFGLIGPDGAGKTTTIRMLSCITEPDNGYGEILTHNFLKEKNKIKENIGYLSQKFSLYENLTVDENIEFFAQIHGIKHYKEKKDQLLQLTNLLEARKRLVGKLSGGMKQKAALICTLIHNPQLIFLDEPTTGVDPVSRREFWKILFTLLNKGITIIVSTPYLDEAERCNRIALMNDGYFLAYDTVTNLKNSFKKIIFEITLDNIKENIKLFANNFPTVDYKLFGDRMHLFLDETKEITSIKLFFDKIKIKVLNIRNIEPSVEHIFISYLKRAHNENKY